MHKLRETTPIKVSSEMALQFICFSAILPILWKQDFNSFQIFRKAIWKHADVQVSSSQHSLYVTTQHFGITASYIDTIFLVG